MFVADCLAIGRDSAVGNAFVLRQSGLLVCWLPRWAVHPEMLYLPFVRIRISECDATYLVQQLYVQYLQTAA